MRVRGLVRVGREESSTREAVLERDVDGRSFGLQPRAIGVRLRQRPCDLLAVLIEHEDVGRERVRGVEVAAAERRLIVAPARKSVPGFEHEYLESPASTAEGDPGREVQSCLEDGDR